MVSLETETDRTLFFDLLPLDVGVIGGFKTRLQLYTVPGQVFYNTTRKLVLKGVDGIVFVADSQRPMLDPNRESLKNLRENLAEIGLSLDEIPKVFQYNKRDLSNILSVDELNDVINPDRTIECHEASAMNGSGVFETLKAISKLTLKSLRSKMSGDAKRPAVVAMPASSASVPVLKPPPKPEPPPPPPPPVEAESPVDIFSEPPRRPASPPGTMEKLARFAEIAKTSRPQPEEPKAEPPTLATAPTVKASPGAATQAFPVVVPPPAAKASASPVPEVAPFKEREEEPASDISFGEKAEEPVPAALESSLKRVRVRSNVDILSELDKLRKVATQKPTGTTGAFPAINMERSEATRGKSSPGISIDDLLTSSLNHKKDVARAFDVGVPRDALSRAQRVTLALRFSGETGEPLAPEQKLDLELSNLRDIHKLFLTLKINVSGE
jgi:hypothetical protein